MERPWQARIDAAIALDAHGTLAGHRARAGLAAGATLQAHAEHLLAGDAVQRHQRERQQEHRYRHADQARQPGAARRRPSRRWRRPRQRYAWHAGAAARRSRSGRADRWSAALRCCRAEPCSAAFRQSSMARLYPRHQPSLARLYRSEAGSRYACPTSMRDVVMCQVARADGRRCGEGVRRCRRRQRPLQATRAFPAARLGLFTVAQRGQQDRRHHERRNEHAERTDRADQVPVGEGHAVVGNAARHAGQAEEVLREEQQVDEHDRPPEVHLGPLLAVHAPGPLRPPVVHRGDQREHRAGYQHVVEVRHHEVGVVVLEVGRHDGQHQAGETTDGEQDDEGHRPQHRRLERQRATPHGADPVEHLHAGRDRDQHGGEHEVDLAAQRHAHGEHVVGPDDERQERDRGGGVHHRLVAEQRLAAEGRDDLADHAEGGQDHDVDLGVPEEPEDVLVHHRVTATGGIEKAGTEELVGQQHGHRAGQHRHHRDQQERGDQPGPAEDRHLQQVDARRAHVQHGGDDVDRAHDRTDAGHVDREHAEGHVVATLQRQRRVQRPATGRRTTGQEQGQQQQAEGHRQQPERPVVHARQRHVRCADLQRDHPVGQADEGRHHAAEDHHQRMHGPAAPARRGSPRSSPRR
ncbi:hypothetical protein G6F65_013813 [Rhizopus arrhizus]|nr:hypothetical protein G6F65_013813 [Rhizopus arrhizus]